MVKYACKPSLADSGVISPEDIASARAGAGAHLRLRIEQVEIGREQPGHCWLSGSIQVLWHDRSGKLSPGMRIRLQVDSRRSMQRCPPGDDLRLQVEQLRRGVVVDAYAGAIEEAAVEAAEPCYRVVCGQVEAVAVAESATSVPPCQASCCGQAGWQLERDLGHALGLDALLGRCPHCGTRSVHLHCTPAARGSYVQPRADDLHQMIALPRGPELKAFLKRWIEAAF